MEVCKELEALSKEFNKRGYKLYIVGGYTRDNLLQIKNDDIDICSNMPVDKVIDVCKELKYSTKNINKSLGTILIKIKNIQLEYTQFRIESYKSHGEHTPNKIEFTDDLTLDCLRRDLTINSIYYDIKERQFIDPVNGMSDLKKQIIKTSQAPSITLSDDGLRILRTIRFASTYNFRIEKKTLKALKIYSPLLNKISKERILKELGQIVVADYKFNKQNQNFMKLCNNLNLRKYIFNSTLSKSPKFTKKEIVSFYNLGKDARLIGFYILVLKKYFIGYQDGKQLSFTVNNLLGINGIRESNNNAMLTEKLYRVYQNLEYEIDTLNASINYLTFSNSEREIIENFLSKNAKEILSLTIQIIKKHNLPTSVHQLDVSAQDLIDEGIDRVYISKILSTLFNQVLQMSVKNKKEDLIRLAKDIHNTFKEIKEQL